MSVGTALVAMKTANSTLSTLVGTKFSPDVAPQNVTLPYITFQMISSPKDNAMGPNIVNHKPRVQMDCYAASAALRTALRTAVINAFYGQSGAWGGETIRSMVIDNEREDVQMLDTSTQAYHLAIDWLIQMA